MNIKTLLSLGALAATGAIYFGKDKYDEYSGVIENLKFNLKNVHNLGFSGGNVTLKADVELINPTATAVTIPGKRITVKNLHFYSLSGKKLGVASPNISDISLPANGSREITNVPVVLDLSSITGNFGEVMEIVSNTNNLKIQAEIEAFGKSFTLNA